jgi:hypothetical protein
VLLVRFPISKNTLSSIDEPAGIANAELEGGMAFECHLCSLLLECVTIADELAADI